MLKYYNIAGLMTSIDDSGPFGTALCRYFEREQLASEPERIDFRIRMAENADDLKIKARYTAISGKFRVNPDEFSVRERYYSYAVRHLFTGGTPELTILWTRKSTPVNALRDAVSIKTIGTASEEKKFLEKTLNYSLFWYVLAVVLLRHGKCFVHSGIFADDAGAHVVAGSAGCGKTSTLLKAMENPKCRYIDEDFGILGEDGRAYYIPKRVTVYEEDAAFGSPVIERALQSMKTGEKGVWKFYGAAGINKRYKFHPEVIFPGQTAVSEKIASVAFVSRSDAEQPVRRELSCELLTEKLMSASFRELKTLYELLNNFRAVGDEEILKNYPSVHELETRYSLIMRQILENAEDTCFIETPFKAGPAETLDLVMKVRSKK